MFYSHQLLARKAPLGQIWMAATMHAKMNRKKLNKLNLITICEEILNPSVPMALRLSGILMGGVVIVYERKVKLLYEDVTKLLVEINEAWKVKPAPDPTILPKGKSQAKKEAVTLQDNPVEIDTDEVNIERSRSYSADGITMHFQRSAYIAMRLDTIDDLYTGNDHGEEDTSHQLYQADVDHIKLFERFDSYQGNTNTFNRFERFDMDGDDETQMNFTSTEHVEIPTTILPSPPSPGDAGEFGQQFEERIVQENVDNYVQPDEGRDNGQDQMRRGSVKRKSRRQPHILDYEQTIIPGHIYQTWLRSTSGLVSRRGRNKKARRTVTSLMKIANLMELPPLVLIDDPFRTRMGEIPYAAPLLQLWLRSSQLPHDSPSARTSPPLPPEPSVSSPLPRMPNQDARGPSVSSPLPRMPNQDARGFFFDDFQNGGGSESWDAPVEVLRFNLDRENRVHVQDIMEDHGVNLNGVRIPEANITTPMNSGDDIRSIHSSGSGHILLSHSEANSGRSNKKRPFYSSSRHSGSGLPPVAEESLCADPNFELTRLSENGLTPELLVETEPTQTQHPIYQPADKLTDSIRTSMKAHFEMPGAPKTESLNKLSAGMNRKGAALLFYQTCVLATSDFLRVKQEQPYGDIILSKGAKM